jgi:hypothetical protein
METRSISIHIAPTRGFVGQFPIALPTRTRILLYLG